ncbi:MAG: acetylornithine transaminase [Mariprofundaceae bacterium]|nr:acetylornithine transaminase [Mariprofundaceae bacterium]
MDCLMQNYARYPLTLVRGQGSFVEDDQGKRYLDFVSGIAVNALGHAHPALTKAITEQAQEMLHCSNLYHIPLQQELAQVLCQKSVLDAAFFCNSGAEANEAAFKLARKYHADQGSERRTIISAVDSFHGRTLATLTATGQEKVKYGFDPLPAGFDYVPYDDVEALEKAINADTAAVVLEPIQGEGGVHTPSENYLLEVRKLCDAHGVLLILDEVQTGIGRTGTMFAFEQAGIRPDVLTLAKGLGGGVPIGAMLAVQKVAASFSAGTHGSTFGGNPLSCKAALTVLSVMESENLLDNVLAQSAFLLEGLKALQLKYSCIQKVKGKGLLLGLSLDGNVGPLLEACRTKGLLIVPAGPSVARFLPPLTVNRQEVEQALGILEESLVSVG